MLVAQRVEKIIEERILTGVYQNGTQLPALRQLSDELSASYVMVSRAVENLKRRNLLVTCPGKGTFARLDASPGLIPNTRVIYFIFADPQNNPKEEYLLELYSHVQQYLRQQGFWDRAIQFNEERIQDNDVPAGAIISGNSPLLPYFREHHIPVVYCGSEPAALHSSAVHPDFYSGSYQVVQYLIKKGLHDIVFVGAHQQENRSSFIAREAGYRDAMSDFRLTVPEIYNWHATLAAEPLRKRLKSNPPEALFVANDVMAVEIMHLVQSLGLRVPDDISIAGLEDMHCGRVCTPSLTTAMYDKKELAVTTAQLLIDQVLGKEHGIIKKEIAMKLIIRESTGN